MLNHQRGLDCSDLNRVIAPEIKADVFYEIIKRLAAPQSLDAVPRASERDAGDADRLSVGDVCRLAPDLGVAKVALQRVTAQSDEAHLDLLVPVPACFRSCSGIRLGGLADHIAREQRNQIL
jgi:hypothetical protein